MKSIAEAIKVFASSLGAAGKFNLQEVKITFSAPNPKRPSTETLTLEKEKDMEANFQWSSYSILFSNKDMDWFIYTASMNPWGTIMTGTPEVISSDSKWTLYRDKKVDLTAREVEQAFPAILRKPELFPKTQVNYMNIHQSDKGHWYSGEEFKKYFDNDFYVVVSKDKSLKNPFGRTIGIKGQPEEK
jgi:hypothetical protein